MRRLLVVLSRVLDIYVVADDDGAQSVMKIHRYVLRFPVNLSPFGV